MGFTEDFADDPDFGESVTVTPYAGAPAVTMNAMVTRHGGLSIARKTPGGAAPEGHVYDVEVRIGRDVCPIVVKGETQILLIKCFGDTDPTIMRVTAIIYNDEDSFTLGMI